jgi:hypothetical protein
MHLLWHSCPVPVSLLSVVCPTPPPPCCCLLLLVLLLLLLLLLPAGVHRPPD